MGLLPTTSTSPVSTLVKLFICYSLMIDLVTYCQARGTIRQRHPGAKQRHHHYHHHRNDLQANGGFGDFRSIPTSMTNDNHHNSADHPPDERISAYFFQWIQKVWNIDTSLVELKDFRYNNYIQAMKDKVDVFYEEETRYYNSFHQIGEERGYFEYYSGSNNNNNNIIDPASEMNNNNPDEPNTDMNHHHQQQQQHNNGMSTSDSEIHNENNNGQGDNNSWRNDYDYYYNNNDDDDIDDDIDDDQYLSVLDYPPVSTRGLAATRDIEAGEIILQIPHAALWTVANRIDNDPILAEVLGFDARLIHGWDAPSDEIPLLAVALLYNFELWRHADEEQGESPYGAYLQLLDDTNVHDLIPHLWDSKTLRRSATVGVRKVAKEIQKDVKELYQRIMVPLIEEHPQIFGNYRDIYNTPYEEDDEEEEEEEEEEYSSTDGDDGVQKEHYRNEEWLFSLERFHWAFALVNSRHWHLPIPNEPQSATDGEGNKIENTSDSGDQIDENGSPPASMPTDEWMDLQQELEYRRDEEERRRAEEEANHHNNTDNSEWAVGNSFLAPLADLLNFGPPSTKGEYNATTNTFDIVATGPIARGQEITFWYADACQDIFMANYGFTMPMMVPPCESERRYHNDGDETGGGRFLSTAQFAERLEQELLSTLDELDQMDVEMEHLVQALKSCDCKPTGNNHHHHEHHESSSQSSPPKHPPPAAAAGNTKKLEEEEESTRHGGGRRPPKPTARIYGDRNQARHAIRGADHNAPASSIRQADNGRRSESLNRSQKRKRRKDNHNMASIRDL